MKLFAIRLLLILLLFPLEAAAHTGAHDAAGLVGGLAHPFSGFDHILAMLAVGMWAGWLGGSYRWIIPSGFVSAAAAGFLLGLGGNTFGPVEQGIALSLIVLGGVLFFRARLALPIGLPLVAIFGLFHGLAHGAEVSNSGEWLFMAGFLASTASLHAAGLLCGIAGTKTAILRIAGAAIATTGLLLVTTNF